jgi:hypothetical protein
MGQIGLDRPPNFGGKRAIIRACEGDESAAHLRVELRSGLNFLGRTRTFDSHASRLGRKLNRSPETAYVLHVWSVGYRLVATGG